MNDENELPVEKVSDKVAFAYLDMLRESGATNMYGAVTYIMRDLWLDRHAAREVLKRWMAVAEQRRAVAPESPVAPSVGPGEQGENQV